MKRPAGHPNADHRRDTSGADNSHNDVDPHPAPANCDRRRNDIAAYCFMTAQMVKGLRSRVASAERERRITASLSLDEVGLLCDRLEDLATLVRKLRDDLTMTGRGTGPGNG